MNPTQFQLYQGYEEQDYTLLESFCVHDVSIEKEFYIDGFGVKTPFACVPFLNPENIDLTRLKFPVPDDGFHAEAIEYIALVDCLTRSRGRNSFVAVELGAGWAPWISMAGVLAHRLGINNITLTGVEASRDRFDLMRRQLETNGLRSHGVSTENDLFGGVFTRLFHGAIWSKDGEIWFPESEVDDMGSAATPSDETVDYRGADSVNRVVPCRKLQTLLTGLDTVDFMHIDIQGSEYDVLCEAIDWVSGNVRTLMIATHSRPIEGKLVDLLIGQGWKLHREKPCRVDWKKECSITGKTVVDGSQYWLNPDLSFRFDALHPE